MVASNIVFPKPGAHRPAAEPGSHHDGRGCVLPGEAQTRTEEVAGCPLQPQLLSSLCPHQPRPKGHRQGVYKYGSVMLLNISKVAELGSDSKSSIQNRFRHCIKAGLDGD